ncbi:hypothetical protein ELZ14_15000 [Pseudomonas brassicacearum]|nr:hypothetical protein ELZ14_15000 [Pseudomonas brassicacearum]
MFSWQAVRIRRPAEAFVVTRHVGDLRVGLYATAGLLEHRGWPRCAKELSEYPVIGPDRNLAEQAFLAQQGFACTGEHAVFRSDDHLAQFAALRSGLGIGVYSSQLARRHALARLLPEQVDFSVDVWIAMQYEAELFKIFHASFGPVTVIGIDGLLVILQAPRTIAVAL